MFHPTSLDGVVEIRPPRHSDARGYLFESFRADRFEAAGLPGHFVQDNVSHSEAAGTVRGLHLQASPFAQGKLVTCLRGRILDVAVDLRSERPSFGAHVAVELSSAAGNQLYVPDGFAHGFCTLEPGCLVTYRLTAPYHAASERSIAFDDPELAIEWPVGRDGAVLSQRDASAGSFADYCTMLGLERA